MKVDPLPTIELADKSCGTPLQSAAREIAKGEWERGKRVMRYYDLAVQSRDVLERVAMKALCVGLVMQGVKSTDDSEPAA